VSLELTNGTVKWGSPDADIIIVALGVAVAAAVSVGMMVAATVSRRESNSHII